MARLLGQLMPLSSCGGSFAVSLTVKKSEEGEMEGESGREGGGKREGEDKERGGEREEGKIEGREERQKKENDSTEKVKGQISAHECEDISEYCTHMLTKLRVISFVEEQVITNALQSKKN